MIKICTGCREEKSTEDFFKNKASSDGVHYYCKTCCMEMRTKYTVKPKTRLNRRESQLKTKYGITLSEYNEMLAVQGGGCAICNDPPRSSTPFNHHLVVDHCHNTNAVRGLLCHTCNAALGLFKDNVTMLRSAIKYLEKQNDKD